MRRGVTRLRMPNFVRKMGEYCDDETDVSWVYNLGMRSFV
jgi:hypothetical protein